MAQTDAVNPLRLGLLWLESDLPPDVEIMSVAANIAASRLDLGLAERLARTAAEAPADAVDQAPACPYPLPPRAGAGD